MVADQGVADALYGEGTDALSRRGLDAVLDEGNGLAGVQARLADRVRVIAELQVPAEIVAVFELLSRHDIDALYHRVVNEYLLLALSNGRVSQETKALVVVET